MSACECTNCSCRHTGPDRVQVLSTPTLIPRAEQTPSRKGMGFQFTTTPLSTWLETGHSNLVLWCPGTIRTIYRAVKLIRLNCNLITVSGIIKRVLWTEAYYCTFLLPMRTPAGSKSDILLRYGTLLTIFLAQTIVELLCNNTHYWSVKLEVLFAFKQCTISTLLFVSARCACNKYLT